LVGLGHCPSNPQPARARAGLVNSLADRAASEARQHGTSPLLGTPIALALAEHGHQLALGVKLQNEPGLTAGDFDAR